jgi:hypothetical protein
VWHGCSTVEETTKKRRRSWIDVKQQSLTNCLNTNSSIKSKENFIIILAKIYSEWYYRIPRLHPPICSELPLLLGNFIIWLSNLSILSVHVPDEGYSRNVSCALNWYLSVLLRVIYPSYSELKSSYIYNQTCPCDPLY